MYCFSFGGPGHVRTDRIKALYNDRALILNATSNMLSSTKRQKLYDLPANNPSKCLQLSLSLATPNPHRNPKQRSRNLYGQNYGWLPLCEVVERSWMHNFCHIIISTATTPNRNLCHQEHPFARDTSGFGTWRSSRISRGNQRKVYRSDNIHVIYIVWHMYACTYSMSVLFHVYT